MILFLAGTSDARELAVFLQENGYGLLATVVTQSAADSLQESGIKHHVGRLTHEEMVQLAAKIGAEVIVDASHPFAEEASKTAMETAKTMEIPYIRFERKSRDFEHELITKVDTYEQAALEAKKRGGTIMLTTGSKTLATFTKHLEDPDIKLYARMLPNVENMEKCANLGIPQKNIIAMQGPFSKQLNHALYKQYGVTLMITKESGKVGSMDEKMEAAIEQQIEVILIRRPRIDYGKKYSSNEEILEQLQGVSNNGQYQF
ncbi:precorrin-6A reductase [Ureibacillus aquaedulcis]|uniref:Precorrin-6A reductase n=1 Tax=Ureibacillus aquaedulcis TaxID=3058421 RepID=A0ABT8GSN8_9BACL|nr:precorrin-6A reductase [Ureibacillus sp. BA0131]MDN4493961.1 precorrin-6A reductase [Ureibacillus sp. BA0131]